MRSCPMITAGLDFVGDQRANSRWSKACNPRVSNWTKLSRIYLVVFVVATIKSRSKPIIFRNILSHIWLDGEESGKESAKCDRRKRMRVGALTYFKLPKITPMRLERVIVKLPHVNSHTHGPHPTASRRVRCTGNAYRFRGGCSMIFSVRPGGEAEIH